MRAKFVIEDKNGMEYFTGAWLSTPEDEKKWAPEAYIFLDGLLVRLEFAESTDGRTFTDFRVFAYVLDDNMIEAVRVSDPDNPTVGGRWKVTQDGRLALEKSGTWFSYDPTDIKALVKKGFDPGLIDAVLEGAKKGGFTFIEHSGAAGE